MSEVLQLPPNEHLLDSYELRVIALDSKDKNRLLVPSGRFRLPSGIVQVNTSIEKAAQLDILPAHKMHLPPMTSFARLDDLDGIKGYVVEPVTGSQVDLRNHSAFSVSAYYADHILENAENYDPIDVGFVSQFVAQAFKKGRK